LPWSNPKAECGIREPKGLTKVESGQMQFDFEVPVGRSYLNEFSTDLSLWQRLDIPGNDGQPRPPGNRPRLRTRHGNPSPLPSPSVGGLRPSRIDTHSSPNPGASSAL
jgi:hypothetical protein